MERVFDKLSIIIPIYNRIEQTQRAIESIENQEYSNIELILIDDGSDFEIFERLSLPNSFCDVIQIRHSENKGANAARNSGFEVSTGDFIMFFDSDDAIQKNSLTDWVFEVKNSANTIGAVGSSSIIIKILDNMIHSYYKKDHTDGIYTLNEYLTSDHINPIGGFSTLIFKREVIDSIGLLDETMPSSQDINYFIKLLRAYNIKLLGTTNIISYKSHVDIKCNTIESQSDNISHDLKAKLKGTEQLLENHKDLLTQKNLGRIYYSLAWYCINVESCHQSIEFFQQAYREDPTTKSHMYYFMWTKFGRLGLSTGIKVDCLSKKLLPFY